MAYNPYTDIKKVYNAKVAYGNATSNEERKTQQDIANKARKKLSQYGYQDIANSISASGADAAAVKKILDSYAKKDRTATREYLYSIGKSYGMSDSEVDKLIGWDADTGQVSFGGKKIGTPDAVADGVSYWNDPTVLDSAFTDYVSRSGLTRTKEKAVDQENEALFKKYTQEYEDLKETNPFTTEEAKSILAKYDLAGLQARDNEAASGGADNSGNIDSFAAANALRQQSTLVNQGQQVVLQQYQQKLDHARNLLSDMGVHIDRVYEQDETSKNNQVSRDVATSEVTGTVPASMLYNLPEYSLFFNEDGTLKNEDIDYKAEIDKAVASGNTNLAKVLRAARGAKIYGNYQKYGQYAADGDYTVPESKKTEAAEQFDKAFDLETSVKTSEAQNSSNDEYVDLVYMEPIDTTKISKYNVDEFGQAALRGLIDLSNKKSGVLTEEEIVQYLVDNSAKNKTNKDQLEKVLAYLGLGSNLLNNVENANVDQSNGGWQAGVKYKA